MGSPGIVDREKGTVIGAQLKPNTTTFERKIEEHFNILPLH